MDNTEVEEIKRKIIEGLKLIAAGKKMIEEAIKD